MGKFALAVVSGMHGRVMGIPRPWIKGRQAADVVHLAT